MCIKYICSGRNFFPDSRLFGISFLNASWGELRDRMNNRGRRQQPGGILGFAWELVCLDFCKRRSWRRKVKFIAFAVNWKLLFRFATRNLYFWHELHTWHKLDRIFTQCFEADHQSILAANFLHIMICIIARNLHMLHPFAQYLHHYLHLLFEKLA